MKENTLADWREILTAPLLHGVIDALGKLAPRPFPERTMKIREQFRDLSPEIMRVAVETAKGRELRGALDSWSSRSFFLQSRLEQSTRPEIARHHAAHFRGKRVLEIGCGIGFDTAALSAEALEVIAIDSDPICCAIAEHNLRIQGCTNVTVVHASLSDFSETTSLAEFDAIWSDPGRRSADGERLYDPADYQPPLDTITGLEFAGEIGIKISPALNATGLSSEWSREFIGWEWSCPEQILWKGGGKPARSATLADHDLSWSVDVLSHCTVDAGMLQGGHFLLEPHPALVRTGDLESFYAARNIAQIDSGLAYGFMSVQPDPSPWYREFRILESFRFTQRALKERLSALGWDSRTQIKKRGVDEDPDQVHRQLKLPAARDDSPWGFVILIRIGNSPQAILAHRV